MQTTSAYLLEKTGLSSEQRQARVQSLHDSISRWLSAKGVSDANATSGHFESETPGEGGTFTRELVVVDDDYAESVILHEKANLHQQFITKVCFVATEERVVFFASGSAANVGTMIMPRTTNARCPSVVRDVIREHRDWTVSEAAVPSGRPRAFTGQVGGEDVCRIITSQRRRFPLVLVSEVEEEFVWDGLDRKLAFDLIGLAYVSSIDSDAGWEVSERLGRRGACFDGAVRLYWPNVGDGADSDNVLSTVWTSERMLDAPTGANAEERFREQLRQRVMAVSALAITEPVGIGNVFRAHARRKLTELQGSVAKIESVYELANSFADDVDKANQKIADLETALAVMTTRAENAESQLQFSLQQHIAESDGEEVDRGGAVPVDEGSPTEISAGDTIFYKKVDSTPNHDIMVRRGDCGHTGWQNSHTADKARKGVERLERRGDWRSFLHCSRCKGGGVWKVVW